MFSHDVIVIGGGITGVGISQALAAAGFSVELWEQGLIGEQTSSNSSKLIHGGLRYLESGQLSLVRQCLQERQALLNLAPSLVTPIAFYIPVYANAYRSAFKIAAGLGLYALLSEFTTLSKFELVPQEAWQQLTKIKKQGLQKIFKYWDAQTDDKLLTQAVASSAVTLGATIREKVSCTSIFHGAHMCQASYIHTNNAANEQNLTGKARTRLIVNACGPWVNQLLEKVTPSISKTPIDWVQGSHLLLDIPAPNGIFYLEAKSDKRMVFVIPWQGKTLLGTTEITLATAPAKPQMTVAEKNYLLAIYCHYFSQYQVAELEQKIIKCFCGIRVLPKQRGSAFNRPRDTEIKTYNTHPCLLTVYGGKLTGFRTTAKQVVNWVEAQLGKREYKANIDSLIIK